MLYIFVGEVSPYAATPRRARVCVCPLNGGPDPRNAPTGIVQSYLIFQNVNTAVLAYRKRMPRLLYGVLRTCALRALNLMFSPKLSKPFVVCYIV